MKTVIVFEFLVLLTSTIVSTSNILMLLPLGSRSHKNIFTPLAESLAHKGHAVTLVSMHAESGNRSALPYNDVVAMNAWEVVQRLTGEFNVFKMLKNNGGKNINSEVMQTVVKNLPEYCDAFLRDPFVRDAWNSNPDLILLPAFMNECGLILVRKFQVPFIYVTTSGLTPWTADIIGNPEHPAYVPNQYLPYSDDMTLWQRTVNSVVRVVAPALRRHYVLGRLDTVAQRFLKDSTVSMEQVEKNVSLVLVNSHHSLGFPRPLQPNVIEVGGMHCRQPQPIVDTELAKFLDSSEKKSVIIFSLGSQIRSSQMPSSFKNLLIRAFSRLPYKVIWKWEGAEIEGLPSNILLKKWLPQQDVLGHPAVGAFFTHGGLLSTQEAIYHGVPLVGLPIMSDQHLNIKQAEAIGVAIGLKLETLTEEDVVIALTKVMEEDSFQQNVKERSMVMRDQETKPLDRATYYTEYVLRHKGAKHLRSSAASLSLTQHFLIDVILVLVLIFFVSASLLVLLLIGTYKGVRYLLIRASKRLMNFLLNHLKTN